MSSNSDFIVLLHQLNAGYGQEFITSWLYPAYSFIFRARIYLSVLLSYSINIHKYKCTYQRECNDHNVN